jgi:hypothetical protein
MAAVVLITIAVSAAGMALTGIHVRFEQLLPKIGLYAVVLGGALFYRWRDEPRFVAALMIVFWMGLVSDLHVFPMFLAGRSAVPFHDDLLAQCDRALGLEVPQVLALMADYPALSEFFDRTYYTLVFLMACALLVPALTLRLKAAQQYVLSCVFAVLICFPFFACFQARGPWIVYGMEPSPAQQSFMEVLAALKENDVFVMDLGYVNGLLCFPSFHTILAILAAAALWTVRYLRWVTALWAGLIVVATVTTGWHYIVDVIAGVAVSAVCIGLARVVVWFGERGKTKVAQYATVAEPAAAAEPCGVGA